MEKNISKNLLQNTKTAILTATQDGKITWANSASEQLFEHSLSYLKELNIRQLLQPIEAPMNGDKVDWLIPIFIEKNNKLLSTPIISHDQWIIGVHQPLFVDYCISPVIENELETQTNTGTNHSNLDNLYNLDNLEDINNQSAMLIEIWSKDRHHRISQEQHSQQQYALARNILRSVAHEVKNPLAGIRGASQLLQRLSIPESAQTYDNKIQTYTELIISETDRLSTLINQLLGIKRQANKNKLNLHEPIEHVLKLNTSELDSIKVIRDYDISLPDINADNEQLIQVFLNVINNAIEAIERQKLTLNSKSQTSNDYIPTIILQTRIEFSRTIGKKLHKKVAKISITDNGAGIDKAFIEQIFFPLVTSRADGTGLGLSLVHDIIEQHQGQIEAMSENGSTCFSIYLPFEQDTD